MFAVRRYALAVMIAAFSLLLSANVYAHSDADQEAATKALAAGEVLPLRTVLDSIKNTYPGRVMNVEFERSHDLWVYKIRLLQSQGRLLKLKVDAKTGEVIATKSRQRRYKGRD